MNPGRRRAWLIGGTLAIVAAVALAAVRLPYFVESPGSLVPLASCVDVGGGGELSGEYYVTTVSVRPADAFDTVHAAFSRSRTLVRRDRLIPQGTSNRDFFARQNELFDATSDIAAAVGLSAAGLDAGVDGDGVEVVGTVPASPAAGVLEAGDVIVAVAGEPVQTDLDLRDAVAASSGAVLVEFERDGVTDAVELVPAEIEGRRVLGVQPQTLNPRVDLPVPVDVRAGPTGGPSAGLMVALTVYDKILSDEDLAAGRRVAGTGTLDETGRVGRIGGIALKVMAAEEAGADVFLTPADQLAEARSGLGRGASLSLVPVADFDDARAALAETAGDGATDDVERAPCPFDD